MEKRGELNILPSYFKVGLNNEEVTKLVEEGRVNKLKSTKGSSVLKIIAKNLFTFFNFLLFGIAFFCTRAILIVDIYLPPASSL